MTPSQLEYRVLQIADQVRAKKPVEDSHIELKSIWPTPDYKTGRRLAGHANAAQLEPIIWIVGLDETRAAVSGASNQELASWWPELQKHFGGLAPSLLNTINVRIDEQVVVALLFDTSRAPFTITVPNASPFDREVPWREGNKTRSATREDLIRILVPIARAPKVELLQCTVQLNESAQPEHAVWNLLLRFYITPTTADPVYFPFHKISTVVQIADDNQIPAGWNYDLSAVRVERRVSNIDESASELIVRGPGLVQLKANGQTCKNLLGYRLPLELRASIQSTEDQQISLDGYLVPKTPDANSSATWTLKEHRRLAQIPEA